ncbi:MAG: PEP-CTERM sorting domain-containing protein [Armatimonadetes bacterium]|nr:PEP-CTERM sorting domain-containing protein [Armatimonadota bacterium]
MKRLALLAAVATLAAGAQAVNLFYSGDTTGAPTWQRPLSMTGLSGTGSAVNYHVQEFHVTVTGNYEFEVFGTTHPDTYIFLYEGGFDPNNQFVGLMGGDDDFDGTFTMLTDNGGIGGGFNSSKMGGGEGQYGDTGVAMTAGVNYYAIVTAFDNASFGEFNAAIGNGQGDVIAGAVPEPTTMAIFGLGAAALAARKRRKS